MVHRLRHERVPVVGRAIPEILFRHLSVKAAGTPDFQAIGISVDAHGGVRSLVIPVHHRIPRELADRRYRVVRPSFLFGALRYFGADRYVQFQKRVQFPEHILQSAGQGFLVEDRIGDVGTVEAQKLHIRAGEPALGPAPET